MHTSSERRIEPAAEVLDAARHWLQPVRERLGTDFLAAYLTGSVLTEGFDPKHSKVNVVVLSRSLDSTVLTGLARAIPVTKKPPHFDPLFLTERQMQKSLDVFPIEWLEIQERHLLLEGEDVVARLQVPLTFLRLQCEHELRGKQIQLRQAYLARHGESAALHDALAGAASGLAALFRTLLRLRGEEPPARSARVVERVADLFRVDASGLLVPYMARFGGGIRPDDVPAQYLHFLSELERLIVAIDQLQTP